MNDETGARWTHFNVYVSASIGAFAIYGAIPHMWRKLKGAAHQPTQLNSTVESSCVELVGVRGIVGAS
jgi:hypothetical protein